MFIFIGDREDVDGEGDWLIFDRLMFGIVFPLYLLFKFVVKYDVEVNEG